MSLNRLYGREPAPVWKQYQVVVFDVIDLYIQRAEQEKPQSEGITRAKRLRQTIQHQLLRVENLNERQLLWRMLDYICMDDGVGPLQTSKKLRSALFEHLCRHLEVTDEDISMEKLNRHMTGLKIAEQIPLPPGFAYCPNDDVVLEMLARRQLAREKLLGCAAVDLRAPENNFIKPLLQAIQAYKSAAAQRFFTGAGIERANMLQSHIEVQWLAIERLNELQVMSRLWEHLAMPAEDGHGLFDTSYKLRLKIAETMCTYLQVDEAQLRKQIRECVDVPVLQVSALGPVPQFQDSAEIVCKLRTQSIRQALDKRVLTDKQPLPPSSGDDIEMWYKAKPW